MSHFLGFDKELNLLLNLYKNENLHPSIIFYGSKGIGKNLLAKKIISEIFKIKFKGNNYTHHDNLLENNTHPNIKILDRPFDQKTKKLKNNISIDQIRSLKKFIYESPSIKSLDKFIIIDSADDLNLNSSNSLLKILEEPNKDTFIFLISHKLSFLLPTIRSRCMKIKINDHNYDNFKKILNQKFDNITENELSIYHELTNGSPGIAISIYEDNILESVNLTFEKLFLQKVDNNVLELIQSLSILDNDKFKTYLSVLKTILINLLKLKITDFETKIYNGNNLKFINDLSEKLSYKNILDRFEFLTNNENDLFKFNLDKKIFMLKFFTS